MASRYETLRGRAAGRAAALAGDGRGGLHRLEPARDAALARPGGRRTRQFLHRAPRATSRTSRRCVTPEHGRALPLHRGRHPRARRLPRGGCAGVRLRAAPGRAGLGAPLDRGSGRDQRRQRRRLPEHAGRRAGRGRRALRLRRLQLDLRRPPRAAEGGGRGSAGRCRPTPSRSTSTSSTPRSSRTLRASSASACATSTSSARGRTRTAPTPP